jgi:hypothetical protein
MHLE